MSEAARDCLLFALILGGTSLPVAGLFRNGSSLIRLAVGIGVGMVLIYLANFFLYAAELTWNWLWLLPLAGGIVCWRVRRELAKLLADGDVRTVFVSWLLLSGWCLGLHALIITYSGGGWAGDWHEHYDRARFFELHWPLDFKFIGFNLLPARPPLTNLVTAGFLGIAGEALLNYQVFTTLLSSLVLFPLAAVAQKFAGGRRATSALTVLLMLNPMLVQNATFPWTKLAAAYFVILAVVFLPRSGERLIGHGPALIALSAGFLAHYSTAPWILALGIAWLWTARHSWHSPPFRRELWWGILGSALLLSTWFGWTGQHYGIAAMINATSTVGLAPEATWLQRLMIAANNIRYTLVPDWNSPILAIFRYQSDWFLRLRDLWFCLFQQNLPLSLGLGNLVAIGWLLTKKLSLTRAVPWLMAIPIVIVVGAAAVTGPVDLGLTHICLQPLVLLSITWVAINFSVFPRWLQFAGAAGLFCDFLLGIVLHFGTQSLIWLKLAHSGSSETELVGWMNGFAVVNYRGKLGLAQPFLGDLFAGHRFALGLGLGALLALALLQWTVTPESTPSKEDDFR